MTQAVASRRTCPVCGATGFAESLAATERMFGLGGSFLYLKCRECGSLRIAEPPADLERYYPEGYYSFSAEQAAHGWLKRAMRRLRDRHALFGEGGVLGHWLTQRFPYPELQSLGRVRGLTTGLRILDVGCGRGGLLLALHGHGFTQLTGVDPFVAADLEVAPGVRVYRRHVHELAGEWDLVMFHHSLEHVPDPAGTLVHVGARLAGGGQVLVRIPIVPSAAFERYRERWVGLDAPRHLFIPTLDGLGRMARAAGMRMTRVVHDSTALQFWGSERYALDLPLVAGPPGSVQATFPPRQLAAWEREAGELNRAGHGDQAAVLFER
jgi:SAM-dependent methyltransferase